MEKIEQLRKFLEDVLQIQGCWKPSMNSTGAFLSSLLPALSTQTGVSKGETEPVGNVSVGGSSAVEQEKVGRQVGLPRGLCEGS